MKLTEKNLYLGLLWFVRFFFIVFLPVIFALSGLYLYSHGGSVVETENAYIKADIVMVSPEVSSRVTNVEVEDHLNLFGEDCAAGDPYGIEGEWFFSFEGDVVDDLFEGLAVLGGEGCFVLGQPFGAEKGSQFGWLG